MVQLTSKRLAEQRGQHWLVDREEADLVVSVGEWAFAGVPGVGTIPWPLKLAAFGAVVVGAVVAPRIMQDKAAAIAAYMQHVQQAQGHAATQPSMNGSRATEPTWVMPGEPLEPNVGYG